jgi:hypothetical protein
MRSVLARQQGIRQDTAVGTVEFLPAQNVLKTVAVATVFGI